MPLKFNYLIVALIAIACVAGCGARDTAQQNHAGHEEAVHGAEIEKHSGEEATAHTGEDAHGDSEEGEIAISPQGIAMAGITMDKVKKGRIAVSVDLSGEVGFNEDRYVHITPRFPGIAKEAKSRLGEQVSEGDVVAVIESNESMTLYSLKSPLTGRIIRKHITPGEYVNGQESVYEIADLSSIWVNLSVYPKDAALVRPGLGAVITAVGSENTAQGIIQYVTPVMDVATRRITARVVLPNASGVWRPGVFAHARINVGEGEECLVVDKDAIQVLNGKNVVFVQHEPGMFKPIEVAVGERDDRRIRIVSGLDVGDDYVNKGAFEIKAKIVTGSLGGHAGHGH
jgi:membrane fusion protein, heavy metal efflux system